MTVSETFDVNASFPANPKHRPAVEALVAHTAEHAGCAAEVAQDCATEVGAAFSAGASTAGPDASVEVRLARSPETFEVVVSYGQVVRVSRPLTK